MRRKNKESQLNVSKNHDEAAGDVVDTVERVAQCVLAVCTAIAAFLALGKKD